MKTDAPDTVWELAILPVWDPSIEVGHVDDRSIVLRTTTDYGIISKFRFFFDVASKQLLKQLEYPPLSVKQILSSNNELYFMIGIRENFNGFFQERKVIARLHEGRPMVVGGGERDLVLARIKEKPLSDGGGSLSIGSQEQFKVRQVSQARTHGGTHEVTVMAEQVGDETKFYKLPKSTFEELARFRPAAASPHKHSGLPIDENYIFEDEGIGPYQIFENRFWFGKTFYDGEGSSGIGGFGYFDPEKRRYVVFSPPEIIRRSVSALLVEERNVWLGLVIHPEGADLSGGLLRYGRSSSWVEQFDVGFDDGEKYAKEVITQIRRWQGVLYLATTDGLFILKDNLQTHYVFEPALDGGADVFKFKSQPLKSL